MRVVVSVFGRLHAYYLADQLEKRGALARLFTSYPRFEVAKYGVPPSKTVTFPHIEAAFRLWLKIPSSEVWGNGVLAAFARWYDARVAARLRAEADIFHGWSTYSEKSIHRARSLGMLCTLQRGSAHIAFQADILREEYELARVRGPVPDPAIVRREEREYEACDYVFVPSEFARTTFVERGFSPQKVIKVPLGVSLAQFYPTPRQDDVFRVIYAGGMLLRKGVHYLLQAFAELRLPDAELWLVGKMAPEMGPFFRRYAGHFRYWGKVRQAELRDYYSQCSAFALCSIEDGFGAVLTQAMACGLPVLCTTNTGGGDVLTDGQEGYILPIRDVDALKARILHLYEHRDACVDMGRLARTRAAAALSWDGYGERISSAFEGLLSGVAGGSGPGPRG
jgi:glycosyltransferase involved in cell wall biosynthesis